MERLSIPRLLLVSALGVVASFVGFFFVSFGAFTAGDEKGYIMALLMLLVAVGLLSALLFCVTLFAAIIRYFQRD
jgi:hypothetical protein